jgi:hypothetical protein
MVDCHRFRRDHLAYLDQALPGEAQQWAELHVVRCAACGAHDALVRRSLMAARSLPDVVPTDGFLARLQARLAGCGFAACGYPHERGGDGLEADGEEGRGELARWRRRLRSGSAG